MKKHLPFTEDGRAVVITGAGSGLGRALAKSLAGKGFRLLLVGRREEALRETLSQCVHTSMAEVRCQVLPIDLSMKEAAQTIVSHAANCFGSISALINNAGLARFGSIELAEVADWESMLHVNLLGPAQLIRHAVPELRKTKGMVVNIGSIGGTLALPGRAFYGASKAALAHITRSLARELAPEIRVNAILPGAIDTEMYNHLGLDEQQALRLREQLIQTTPLGRMGETGDIVPWIEMLLGPAGQWVTGSLFVIDGGRSC